MEKPKKTLSIKLNYNSPVIITYTIICFAIVIVGYLTQGASTTLAFTLFKTSFSDPMMYFRLISYTLGHTDIAHFTSNFMLILLTGPIVEEKYGGKKILVMMIFTALITGIINILLFPKALLCGASGIAFMLILLSSFVNVKDKKGIPVTVILVAVFYLGTEIINGITSVDDISQTAHILGGILGCIFGTLIIKEKI